MPWPRREPDPLEAHRRRLEEQQRALDERMSQLTSELRQAGEPTPPRPLEPPVWRLDDDLPLPVDSPARRGALARQRRRDRLIFFICIALLLLAAAIWYWIYSMRDAMSSSI